MSYVTSNQPNGTPTWIDLGIPDLDRAMAFYGAVFGWEFRIGPAESGSYTICLLADRAVAAIMPHPDTGATDVWWNVYLATDDCDLTAQRITEAGGTLLQAPMDVMEQGRMAIARRPGRCAVWPVAGARPSRLRDRQRAQFAGPQRSGHPDAGPRPGLLRRGVRLHARPQ